MDVKVSKAAYKLAHELEDDGYETHCAMIKILCQEIAKLDACFLRLGSRFTEAKQSIKVLKAENEALKAVLQQEGIGVGRDLLNGGIALFRKAQEK